jgi:hypothetical protein
VFVLKIYKLIYHTLCSLNGVHNFNETKREITSIISQASIDEKKKELESTNKKISHYGRKEYK